MHWQNIISYMSGLLYTSDIRANTMRKKRNCVEKDSGKSNNVGNHGESCQGHTMRGGYKGWWGMPVGTL